MTQNGLTPSGQEQETESISPNEESSGAGLRFESLDPEQKERINEFIRRNIREDLH